MRLLPRFRRQKEGERADKKGKKKKAASEDAAPRAPAEEVYGCFVQFDPAIIPEEIHVPQWLVSAVRAVKNNIIDPLNPLAHNVAEVDHKLPYLDQRPDRSTVELTEPAVDMVQITIPQKRLDESDGPHYDRSHKPSMPVFKPGFRTVILVEGIICYIVMGTQW